MHAESRQEILSQLREIYDGSFKKAFGTGKVLEWKGKLGFLAGCTPVLDSHYSIFSVLGERFITLRVKTPDPIEVSEYLIDQAGRETQMRETLAEAFAEMIHGIALVPTADIAIEPDVKVKLSRLAAFVVRARSGVVRDSRSRELEYVPEPEAPTRLTLQLRTLLQAITLLDAGFTQHRAYRIVHRVGMDCIPQLRRRILERLKAWKSLWITTTQLSDIMDCPTSTIRRACEDLLGLELIDRQKASKPTTPHSWTLRTTTGALLEAAQPQDPEEVPF
jgi:hypothetical protein